MAVYPAQSWVESKSFKLIKPSGDSQLEDSHNSLRMWSLAQWDLKIARWALAEGKTGYSLSNRTQFEKILALNGWPDYMNSDVPYIFWYFIILRIVVIFELWEEAGRETTRGLSWKSRKENYPRVARVTDPLMFFFLHPCFASFQCWICCFCCPSHLRTLHFSPHNLQFIWFPENSYCYP